MGTIPIVVGRLVEVLRRDYELDVSDVGPATVLSQAPLKCSFRINSFDRVLLKEKAFYLGSEEFPVHLAVHQYLQSLSAPVPRLLSNRGALWFQLDKSQFEVQEWVNGMHPYNEPYGLGRAVGAVHEMLASYRGPGTGDWAYPVARRRWFPDRPDLLIEHLTFLPRFQSDGPSLASLFRKLRDKVAAAADGIDWAALPEQWLHGDAAPDNAVIDQRCGGVALVDFDDARWGFRCWEVAQLAATVGGIDVVCGRTSTIRDAWCWEELHLLLAGYQESFKIREEEKWAFDKLLRVTLVLAAMGELNIDEPGWSGATMELEFERLIRLIGERSQLVWPEHH
jgi:Ser/Thr protein kinase RdoA (MazF antagonist)